MNPKSILLTAFAVGHGDGFIVIASAQIAV